MIVATVILDKYKEKLYHSTGPMILAMGILGSTSTKRNFTTLLGPWS